MKAFIKHAKIAAVLCGWEYDPEFKGWKRPNGTLALLHAFELPHNRKHAVIAARELGYLVHDDATLDELHQIATVQEFKNVLDADGL